MLYVDASDTCIGAYLAQPDDENETSEAKVNLYFKNEKPIYFLSHRLSKTQRKWQIIEKECYSIFYSLNKLSFYLTGATFVIRTDRKPLKYLLEADIKNRRVALWSLSLASYSCKIEYLPRNCNTVADLMLKVHKDPNVPTEGGSSAEESLPEINDKTYEIEVFDSNQIPLKEGQQYASSETELLDQPRPGITTLNMQDEQAKDPEI